MLNIIWLFMMTASVIVAVFTGKIPEIITAATDSAKFAFTLALGLTGVMALWLGIMKVAEAAGLLELLTRALKPLLVKLFPDVPAEHPAMGAMTMNIAANIFGLNNAATPFGLRAMVELAKLNKHPGVATNTMCTFLALHSSNLQIVPATAIALLATTGALHPTDIIIPFLLSSLCAVVAAIIVPKILERLHWFRYPVPAAPQEEGASS
ncbi:MAG: nucleoside recognition domain-containing protein [Pseudomonadota bacterium]